MSRSFNGASGNHLNLASAPITAPAFSMGAWINPTSYADRVVLALGALGGINNCFTLRINASGNAVARTRNTGNADAVSSTTVPLGVWSYILAVYAGINDRRIYVAGGGKIIDTNSRTVTGVNTFVVGTEVDDSSARFAGLIAQPVIYNAVLSDANAVALAAGANPQNVVLASLINYWTLNTNANPEVPVVGGSNLTVTGATYSASNPTVGAYGKVVVGAALAGGFQELSGGLN